MRRLRVVLLQVLAMLIVIASLPGKSPLYPQPLSANPSEEGTVMVLPGGINGTLYAPDGVTPVAGAWIDITDADGDPWVGSATDDSGYFNIVNLPQGAYTLRAYPAQDSPYAGSLPVTVEVISGAITSQALYVTEPVVTGWVQLQGDPAQRIPGAFLVAHNEDWSIAQWDTSNANGEFKIGGLEIGVEYTLEAYAPAGSSYVPVGAISVTPIATDVVVEMFTPTASVIGMVFDPDGKPVYEATVAVYNDTYWEQAITGEDGFFAIMDVPEGEYWVQAYPPYVANGLVESEPISITISNPSIPVELNLILPSANKTLFGQILLDGVGVPNALVWANRLDAASYASTVTDEQGYYKMPLTGGKWIVGVEPLDPSAGWYFPGPPAPVKFNLDTTPQEKEINLKVKRTDAQVSGRIVCPGGELCPGDPPADAIKVVLDNDHYRFKATLAEDYTFALTVPAGWYDLSVHVTTPKFQGPDPSPIYVEPGQSLNVGDIALRQKDGYIAGVVYDEFGNPVAGAPIIGWRSDASALAYAETDENGYYTMPVFSGKWFVTVDTTNLPYVLLNQPPILVKVAPGGSVSGVNFVLTLADARIKGVAIDNNLGQRIRNLDGWAWAERIIDEQGSTSLFSQAPMRNGLFRLKAMGAASYYVNVYVPPEAAYVPASVGPVDVEPGERVTVYVPMHLKDARISGDLVDEFGELLPDVEAIVFGHDGRGNWVSTYVDPETAEYTLEVTDGTWHLNVWVNPYSGYVADMHPVEVTLSSGQTVYQDFTLWPINTSISGVIYGPDGLPVAGAYVYAQGESPYVGYYESYTVSGEDGSYVLPVLDGLYTVGASLPDDVLRERGWLNPRSIADIQVTAAEPALNVDFTFLVLDATISGIVTFAPHIVIDPLNPVYIWAYSDSGEWAETTAPFSGGVALFSLPVVSGVDWHIGAVYDDSPNGRYFASDEVRVMALTPGEERQQDLMLYGPFPLPQPTIISFDALAPLEINLPDGFHISIPPGALATSGRVTLYIFPTQELRPAPGQHFVGPGYNLWATDESGELITHFNRHVVLSAPYLSDAELAELGISEFQLIPVYFSTLLGNWILADGYLLDADANRITLQVNHFTKFGFMNVRDEAKPLFLPLVQN